RDRSATATRPVDEGRATRLMTAARRGFSAASAQYGWHARSRTCDREHVAPVRDVAAVQVRHLGIGEDLGDHGLRGLAVVHTGGLVDPAPAVVGAQHLRAPAPLGRVVGATRRAATWLRMDVDRAGFAVRARWQRQLVREEDRSLAGFGVAQAAAQRLTALGDEAFDGHVAVAVRPYA